ncbi:MAG TPA: hypothetical protein VN805_06645 [Caulobacteraceae bacterium]|nr:hypothetical protein [Caulobacteraceae bacterium]
MKSLLISASALVLAATPASAASGDVCQTAAARIRTLPAAAYDPSSDLTPGPIERLADNRASGVVIDASNPLTADQVQALDATLKSRFNTPAAILTAVDGLDPAEADNVWLRRLGASDVYAVETMAGTMDCEGFVFFDAPAGKAATAVATPPELTAIGDDGASFCVTAEGFPGQVGATPVFIAEGWDSVAPVYDIDIAAWGGGAWAKPCSLHVVFRSSYRVDKVDCSGGVCAQLPAAALAMAERREAQIVAHGSAQDAPPTFAWGPALSAAARARVATLTPLIGDPPTLDVSSVTGDTSHGFAEDTVIFPVVLAGQAYAAVLSHGGIGWRIYPDFVLSLYDLKAGAAERVASVHVVREVGPVQSIRVAN